MLRSRCRDEDSDRDARARSEGHRGGRGAAAEGDLRGKALGLQPVVWIGIMLSVFQQFVGINVIFYYSTTLWQAVGFSEEDSFTISVVTAITNIAGDARGDRARRPGRAPADAAGRLDRHGDHAGHHGARVQRTGDRQRRQRSTPPGRLGLGRPGRRERLRHQFFGAIWGPLVWVLLGEMFPNRIRARRWAWPPPRSGSRTSRSR